VERGSPGKAILRGIFQRPARPNVEAVRVERSVVHAGIVAEKYPTARKSVGTESKAAPHREAAKGIQRRDGYLQTTAISLVASSRDT
jgi:hypothetical protein